MMRANQPERTTCGIKKNHAETIKIYLGEITKKESIFTAIFEKVDHWYIGHVEELPGANTQGKTLEEGSP